MLSALQYQSTFIWQRKLLGDPEKCVTIYRLAMCMCKAKQVRSPKQENGPMINVLLMDLITGMPVSQGEITGTACVVRNVEDAGSIQVLE